MRMSVGIEGVDINREDGDGQRRLTEKMKMNRKDGEEEVDDR